MFDPNIIPPKLTYYSHVQPKQTNKNSSVPLINQQTPKLTKIQKEVLYGILLGDGSLQSENGGKTYRLRFTQKNKAYAYHVYGIFQNLVRTEPKFNAANQTWYWNTLQNSCFRFYGQQFYDKDGTKKVPAHIERWLSLRTMAYWYSDDGTAKDKETSSSFRFCTDSFSKQDVNALVDALQNKYCVYAKIFENRPNQYRIYIGSPKPKKLSPKGKPLIVSEKEFGQQFLPYIIPEMRHKIPPRWLDV